MASTSLSVQTVAILGTTVVGVASVASSETCTINPTTAQGALDFATLKIRIQAVGGSVTPTLGAGTVWSGRGQGAKTLTTIASSASAIIGGQDFESARFAITAGSIVFTMVGTGTASIEAYQSPRASE